jgi:heme/copper-type cytochrome/quinol oxidase subunit 3
MQTSEPPFALNRFLQRQSNLALVFFVLSSALLALAGGTAWLLVRTSSFTGDSEQLIFPSAFLLSSACLAAGSWTLHRACQFVRIERQQLFRQQLVRSVIFGTTFVAIQTYAMWCLLIAQRSSADVTGLRNGAFAFVAMHALHFVVALLFVAFILLRAFADRYDHEYSWGVTFCAWFWHTLGIVWLMIMSAFLVGSTVLT